MLWTNLNALGYVLLYFINKGYYRDNHYIAAQGKMAWLSKQQRSELAPSHTYIYTHVPYIYIHI